MTDEEYAEAFEAEHGKPPNEWQLKHRVGEKRLCGNFVGVTLPEKQYFRGVGDKVGVTLTGSKDKRREDFKSYCRSHYGHDQVEMENFD